MRWSKLGNKEIVDLDNGERLGMIGECDFLIDERTGNIDSLLLTAGGFMGWGRSKQEIAIPWMSIRKIGAEIVIIEWNRQQYRMYD